MGMHFAGTVETSCEACGRASPVELAAVPFRHLDTWMPSLLVVERFEGLASLPCGHPLPLRLEVVEGMGSVLVKVFAGARQLDPAAQLRAWSGPGGVEVPP